MSTVYLLEEEEVIESYYETWACISVHASEAGAEQARVAAAEEADMHLDAFRVRPERLLR